MRIRKRRFGVIMYYEGKAEDPRSADEFWDRIKEAFENMEIDFEMYYFETKKEAENGVFEEWFEEPAPISFTHLVRYRRADDRVFLEQCYQTGCALLDDVKSAIGSRDASVTFAWTWGRLQFCHGLLTNAVLTTAGDMEPVRRAKQAALASTAASKKWLFMTFEAHRKAGKFSEILKFLIEFERFYMRAKSGGPTYGYDLNWLGDFFVTPKTEQEKYRVTKRAMADFLKKPDEQILRDETIKIPDVKVFLE